MSLIYLLDGYNVIKQHPQLAEQPLDAGRASLARWIDQAKPHGSSRNSITIVFDGRPGLAGAPASLEAKIIFTDDETADERIKRLVDRSANPKVFVVVTNDKEIKFHVRALGAKVLSVQEFFALGLKSGNRAAGGASTGKKTEPKYISLSLEQQITSELTELWIKKKNR